MTRQPALAVVVGQRYHVIRNESLLTATARTWCGLDVTAAGPVWPAAEVDGDRCAAACRVHWPPPMRLIQGGKTA